LALHKAAEEHQLGENVEEDEEEEVEYLGVNLPDERSNFDPRHNRDGHGRGGGGQAGGLTA